MNDKTNEEATKKRTIKGMNKETDKTKDLTHERTRR